MRIAFVNAIAKQRSQKLEAEKLLLTWINKKTVGWWQYFGNNNLRESEVASGFTQ